MFLRRSVPRLQSGLGLDRSYYDSLSYVPGSLSRVRSVGSPSTTPEGLSPPSKTSTGESKVSEVTEVPFPVPGIPRGVSVCDRR